MYVIQNILQKISVTPGAFAPGGLLQSFTKQNYVQTKFGITMDRTESVRQIIENARKAKTYSDFDVHLARQVANESWTEIEDMRCIMRDIMRAASLRSYSLELIYSDYPVIGTDRVMMNDAIDFLKVKGFQVIDDPMNGRAQVLWK